MEEIRHITWDLWGQELSHVQTIQRIIVAGFPIHAKTPSPHSPALDMFAIVEGESGEYQRAWHANVERWDSLEDKPIRRYEQMQDLSMRLIPIGEPLPDLYFMRVKSIDLGFMQINKTVNEFVEMGNEAVENFVEGQFIKYPRLAVPTTACEDALLIWKARGFQPWYAYQPGTEKWRGKKRYGAIAFAQWLVNSFVGADADGKVPQVGYK
jgi:hypothetical protein